MFLLKATVETITNYWPLFKGCIASAFPPTDVPTEKSMLEILQQLLAGRMQLWIAHKSRTWPIETFGVVTTSITHNMLTGSKGLLIFSAYTWHDAPIDLYEVAIKTLSKYAKSEGCDHIHFYSANPRVLQMARHVGMDTEFTYGIMRLT